MAVRIGRAHRATIDMVVLAGTALLLAADCFISPEAGAPAGGISRDEAIATAMRQGFPVTRSEVADATPGPLWEFGHDVTSSPDRWVWAVTFKGSFEPPSCGPYRPGPPAPCLVRQSHFQVILDYFTGKLVIASQY